MRLPCQDAAMYLADKEGERSDGFIGDVRVITRYLSETTSLFGAGIAKLRSKKMSYEGKQIALFRLAPNQVAGLRLNDRYMRAVFGFHENTVIIDKICTHAKFDKTYAG